jgi:hypothetical protein
MDNETPQPSNVPPANNQEPVSQPTDQPSSGFSGGMKVIQPLSTSPQPESTAPQVPAQPTPVTPQEPTQTTVQTPPQSTATPANPQPAKPDPSSIYPDVSRGVGANKYPTPSSADTKKDAAATASFSEGYSLGGTIFWYQLIAGIVFGLIFYGLTMSVLKTTSTSLAAIVGLLHYVIEYLVLIYVPYSVLKSNAVEEPFWLTLFGVASQSVIVGAAFGLVDLLIVRTIINHGVSSSLTHIGGSGLAATGIIVYIGFLIASYFLTKLSWGVAFNVFSKITNKAVVKAIGIGVIAVIVGGIGYHYLTLPSKNSPSQSGTINTSSASGLTNYNVNSNTPFSVDFFKGAIVTSLQGQTILIDSQRSGEQAYIFVSTTTTPTTSCTFSTMPTFAFHSQGTKGLGCYGSSGSDGYIQVNGQNYHISLRDDINVSQQTTETIFNSITIK